MATFISIFSGGSVVSGTTSPYRRYANRGSGRVQPKAIVSTFGPFPASADIGIDYTAGTYSGVSVEPALFRGFELKVVGEALDLYSDIQNGFEYRIDCAFDSVLNKFTKTFVLIPTNKENPPRPGEVAPLSRYGADKIVFEYPGNITSMTLEESAEDAVTRMFVSGENDLGPDAGPPIGVATNTDLLLGKGIVGRRWPLLDESESVEGVEDELLLYSYAEKYLNESRPPDSKFEIKVNGALSPEVGEYAPGDWCSVRVEDEFVKRRLQTDLEPRDDVLVRKIDAVKVSVPDGPSAPETVTLILTAEWGVDAVG